MFEKITDHEERIIILEKSDVEILRRVEKVEGNYVKLENTILKGNQAQQQFFESQMNKQWDLITTRDKSKDEARLQEHELLVGRQGIIASNWSKVWEVSGKLFTAGGIGYLIFEAFFAK